MARKITQQQKLIKALQKKLANKIFKNKKALRKRVQQQQKKKDEDLQRKIYYSCILNNVAAVNVPQVVQSIFKNLKIKCGKMPTRTTVNRMVGELGFLSDYVTADAVLNSTNATLIFDATTQDGIHVNCILLSTSDSCHLVSIKQLPGGTAKDYKKQVCDAVDALASIYSSSNEISYVACQSGIIEKLIFV